MFVGSYVSNLGSNAEGFPCARMLSGRPLACWYTANLSACDDSPRPANLNQWWRYRKASVWRNMPGEVRIQVDVDAAGHYGLRVGSGRSETTTSVNPDLAASSTRLAKGWFQFHSRLLT